MKNKEKVLKKHNPLKRLFSSNFSFVEKLIDSCHYTFFYFVQPLQLTTSVSRVVVETAVYQYL